MLNWAEFVAALLAFLLSHGIILRPVLRGPAESLIGRRGFSLSYGVLSTLLLAWVISAAGRAPYVELWPPAIWHNEVALAVMFLVCMIVALALGTPNPFSFGGGRNTAFDPAQPGLIAWFRHPLLVALALWASVHMLANGDLAHVVMFAIFAVFALLGQLIIDRRKRRELGPAWAQMLKQTRQARKPSPLFFLRKAPLRMAAGLLAYAILLVLHPYVIGVNPLPW